MGGPILPQDIMLLICQELGARHDFASLYRCSTVSRRVASIAVEQLYSIIEVMDPFIEDKRQTAQLWRSIILSSLGVTIYPYCAYIRALSLGNLVECLDDFRLDQSLRDDFFEGPMQEFQILREISRPVRSRSARQPPLDTAAITSKCADSITQYIKGLADNNGTTVALTHLEASHYPPDVLPIWISRLSTLKALRLRDGSVLNTEVGRAIAQGCPSFAELTCLHCSSETAAEDMANFLLTLRPNTLRRFEVLSRNTLNEFTLAALSTHSESLQALNLGGLESSAFKSLHLLSKCTALEVLLIEKATTSGDMDSSILSEVELGQVAGWISSCKALRELSFFRILDSVLILHQVLQAPDIRLVQLTIQNYRQVSEGIIETTWRALGEQTQLESFTIGAHDSWSGHPDPTFSQSPELVNAICRLSNLTTLNLMEADVSSAEIHRIITALPRLEELTVGGDAVDSSVLEPLSRLPKLVSLAFNAATKFTFREIWDFAHNLDMVTNRGIRLDVLTQWATAKLSEQEERRLGSYFVKNLNGRFAISYAYDPDELHESDFTDSD